MAKITIDNVNTGMILLDMLEIEPICHSCKGIINDKNFGAIFKDKNDIVLSCNSIFCLNELLPEETIEWVKL